MLTPSDAEKSIVPVLEISVKGGEIFNVVPVNVTKDGHDVNANVRLCPSGSFTKVLRLIEELAPTCKVGEGRGNKLDTTGLSLTTVNAKLFVTVFTPSDKVNEITMTCPVTK